MKSTKESIEKFIKATFPDFQWKTTAFEYEVKNKKKILSLDEVLEGLNKRIPYIQSQEKAFSRILGYYFSKEKSWLTPENLKETHFYTDFFDFLKAMGRIKAHEGVEDQKLKTLLKDYDYSEAFIEWFRDNKNLSLQQIVCEHDQTDTFATDGQFYNSVGTCEKCGCEENESIDSEEVAALYEAFLAGQKSP